MEKAFFR